MRPLVLSAAMAAALSLAPCAAHAHAYPKTTSPANHAKLTAAPSEVSIEFDDELEPKFSSIVVHAAKGATVSDGAATVAADDAKHLSVKLKPLPAGTYTVMWKATDTDTHKTHGQFSFTVAP